MAEALARRGHEMHVVTYPLGDESHAIPYNVYRVAEGYKRLDPRPGPSLAKLLYLDPLLCARIRKMLASMRFDIVHAHHYEGLIASLLARRLSARIPIVYDAHTLLESELPQYRTGLSQTVMATLGRTLDRRIPPRADHVIAVTAKIQSWLAASTPIAADAISVIGNGVEHEHFSSDVGACSKQVPGPHVVFAGNLAEYQGIDLLLHAFVRVLAERADAHLSFLTASNPDDVMLKIDELGIKDSVSFRDPDYASLPSCLAAADVLVNPRVDCDGIPQKLLNYMAAGRPIVSFESSAWLLEHEKEALIVPDGDVQGFAAAAIRLMREPELGQALGQAAQKRVVAGYSWEKVAERVESVYGRTLGPGR